VFEIRLDDGDGIYEPDGADAPVLATLDARFGFAVFLPPAPGDYWITEVTPPPGLTVAPPMLVRYSIPSTSMNCAVLRGKQTCSPDDDDSGGFLVAVVVDSPSGGTAPDTNTTSPIERTPTDLWLLAVGAFAVWVFAFSRLIQRRRD